MQFEGLQGLLKKKKQLSEKAAEPPAQPTTSTTTASTCDSNKPTSTADPYAAAVQRAQQRLQQQQQNADIQKADGATDHESRKRSRELSVNVNGDEDDRYATAAPRHTSASEAKSSEKTAATASSATTVILNAEDIRAAQQRGVAALQHCRTQLEKYWARERQGKAPVAAEHPSHHPPLSLSSSLLPHALTCYLTKQFVSDQRITAATGEPEVALVDRESVLLAALYKEVVEDDAKPAVEAATSAGSLATEEGEWRKVGETVCVLWYLIALRWQYSLDPCQITATTGVTATKTAAASSTQGLPPDQQGWSPYVYLALQGALPPDVRLTIGHAVAQEVEQWRARTRTRQFALELLAYLYSDYVAMTTTTSSAAAPACIVPAALRENLHAMLVQHLQRDHNYMAVRQDYVDMTMGTANWKLGLFSGGEVHMRRSMERVERNRIHHLLNNEHATHLLQSVREVTTFVEQQKPQVMVSFFYSHA
jgi:pre-mRNA-splicing factor 18